MIAWPADAAMRNNLGMACQIVGLGLMPAAVIQGMQENGSLGNELLLGGASLLLIFVGRGIRGGGDAK